MAPPPPPPVAQPERPADVGATGRLPRDRAPGKDLIENAGDPRALATGAGPMVEMPDGPLGIPGPMLAAYREGAQRMSRVDSSCGVHWSLLASIGRIESGHARSGRIDAEGTTVTAILGPRLDGGQGVAAIADTDGGRYDGDPVWDRAVGPMQFIPSTWQRYGVDGNGDGTASPHNVHDAVVTAGRYLCAGDVTMSDEDDLVRAVFRYNHSESYVREVLLWAAAYREGVRPLPVEVAPDVDDSDVLAGHRLSYRPLRLDPGTPAPPPDAAPMRAPRVATPPASAPSGATAPPPAPSSPGTSSPAPSDPAPSAPPSSSGEPPPSGPPPSGPPPSERPSSEPPSSEPPSSSTSPSEPPPSSAPPSEPPSSSEPSSSESSPSTTPPSGRTQPDETPPPCEPTRLDSGEFVTEERRDEAEPGIEPGTTDPAEADPGEIVYVDRKPDAPDGGGALEPCRVPSGDDD